MEVSAGTKLKQELSSNYKSFNHPSEPSHDCSYGSTCDLNKNREVIQQNRLTSSSSDSSDQSSSKVKPGEEDCCGRDQPLHIYAFCTALAIGVTLALFLEIHLAATWVPIRGVVSDHELCTALSEGVLRDGGSSVDAAVAGSLCLGVVHPHVSGVGGGGVMLVHKVRQNETRVISFQGSAPQRLREEMLRNASDQTGLLVGVPGMLMGLHHAHSLYGYLSWDDLVSRAAAVAREGFNVSQSLSDAISQVGDRLVGHLRELFIPNGRALSPGSYLRMPGVADVLQAGLFSFYYGSVSQELEDEVRTNGGVLSREDLQNYSAEVQRPLEGRYNDFILQVPPPPSAGAALIAALNLLESFHTGEKNGTENQTYHWINKALTAALTMAGRLGDPENSSVSELLSVMISKNLTEVLLQKTDFQPSDSNWTVSSLPTSQVTVMGPDDLVVSVASSLNRPFGSRIMTRSGVILNSLVQDTSRSNQSRGQPRANQKTRVEPGRRPLSFLMPSVVVPVWSRCGTYMALSSSGGPKRLREITQMLDSVLFHHEEKNHSLSLSGR